MRVLIAPMAAMAETSGPFSRAATLCCKLIDRGHEAALCAAEDVNYREIENIKNYYAPVPSILGLPSYIGKRMAKVVQKLGVQEKKEVHSFEQVLFFTGAINKKHFREDVFYIRKAIQEYKPDVVYAEFRISAIVAAKIEKVKVVTGYSYPVQKTFACNPEYSLGVKGFLRDNHLPSIQSVLEIFDWADLKVVPSSYELEPIESDNTVFVGPFSIPDLTQSEKPKNKIITYMGYGTIHPNIVIKSLTKAFEGTNYQVYIATQQVEPYKKENICVDKRFDFRDLMPDAAIYINHGGQNSIMTGLLYGVPQIIYPGNVFERKYNAASIVNLKAGIALGSKDFNADKIKDIVNKFERNPEYMNNAIEAGKKLAHLGGADRLVDMLEQLIIR